MSDEELHARRVRVKRINDVLAATGYMQHALVLANAGIYSEEQLVDRERMVAKIQAANSGQSMIEAAADKGRVPGVLGKLVGAFRTKRQEADEAVAAAEADLRRIEGIQAEYERRQELLKEAQATLALARELHARQTATLAELNAKSPASMLSCHHGLENSGLALYDHCQSILVISEVVKLWPRTEKELLERVRALESEVARLEREYA